MWETKYVFFSTGQELNFLMNIRCFFLKLIWLGDWFVGFTAYQLLQICSSHRSIFSCKSMPLPSDSATHRPISGQSALIPSSSKELFFLALFGSLPQTESTRPAEKKDRSPVACHGTFQHWRSSLKITAATCDTDATWHQKELFSRWHKSTFCHKNKPLIVVLQRSFVILFSIT